ncbi:MAG: nucleotidyltransferase domain-containing protein [Calditrichaeota bacterium]|nr:nucleotidyltransferase domain-containing protein [Calditrichota bacterium]MCB9367504.1 nucleotidyltransferase domain-containing protein [Calditrichota bacterium]
MDKNGPNIDKLLHDLSERAKELNCLYQIEELLKDYGRELDEVLSKVVEAIPAGWQFSDVCCCKLDYGDHAYCSSNFAHSPWSQTAGIVVQGLVVGRIHVHYLENRPQADSGPFLKEEVKLIQTISERIAGFIQHQKLNQILREVERARDTVSPTPASDWRIVIDMLAGTNTVLYNRIARKLLITLCRQGTPEAIELQRIFSSDRSLSQPGTEEGENQPRRIESSIGLEANSESIFRIASEHMPSAAILNLVQDWMKEDRAGFLLKAVSDPSISLGDVISAVRRFVLLSPSGIDLPDFTKKSIRVALLRRIFSDDLDYIRIAKEFVNLYDFHDLLSRVVYPSGSHGRLGGKSAGLFLAESILKKHAEEFPELAALRVPKTWYIASDAQSVFVHYNNLEEVVEQKYKDIAQVRQEYAHVIQLFKNSQFPPDMLQGLSMALDDFGDKPLVVRSSSLLEDRFGAAFSGKYKSLFLANQGTKAQRLSALTDAIAEVYSSTFGPDPIEYRIERGLVDFHEEMSVMIQEVVGTHVGKFFLPSWAGVAFSNNEFRWSPRIRREDGLVRMVPGLGTRAVDRLSDDYPVLAAPGQPGLRVNVSPEEIARYSPSKIDVINLEENCFETISVQEFLECCGDELPDVANMVSILDGNEIRRYSIAEMDVNYQEVIVTFRTLFEDTAFLNQMHRILSILQETIQSPVDIEFASDGSNLHLLQCRPQSAGQESAPAVIPRDFPDVACVFSANKYISNGTVPDVTHIVYVDPEGYASLEGIEELRAVGRAVGELNKLLPKRQFVLMGPGRWGSRGDIKLGVNVTYSDINNSAVLIEIARRIGNYVPDLSFGTHFFQDLVEAGIRYLPLYPDDPDVRFNLHMLQNSPNILKDLIPAFAHLEKVIRVIDVPACTGGKVLKVFMNADSNEAVGILSQPSALPVAKSVEGLVLGKTEKGEHWQWRSEMVERLARSMNAEEFGVRALYIIGSTKNGTAGPGSDIDLLIHFAGTSAQQEALHQWLKGWSLCLDEINYLKTGYRSTGLLDVHMITDEDIKRQTSYAVKINAVTDSAREIPIGSN